MPPSIPGTGWNRFAGSHLRFREMSAEELAKLAQDPVGNLISLPFQNNTNLNFGPQKGPQDILNIQPVVPIFISNKVGGAYNNGLVQPFVNYNFAGGLYLTSAPILTVDWKADSGQQWTVPIGSGVGKIFHVGKLPVNTQISAYYNVVRPDFQANWQVRAQAQLMFPK